MKDFAIVIKEFFKLMPFTCTAVSIIIIAIIIGIIEFIIKIF